MCAFSYASQDRFSSTRATAEICVEDRLSSSVLAPSIRLLEREFHTSSLGRAAELDRAGQSLAHQTPTDRLVTMLARLSHPLGSKAC